MWSAIKSDLLDFVSTIQEDTSRTLNKVMGDDSDEEEEVTLQEKMIADARRSFSTYGTAIDSQYAKDFEKFMKNFSLSSNATDIANILDVEPDVSRYYAELVPTQVRPEEFWGRYYFRVLLITRGGVLGLGDDDEEEEELVWESTDKGEDSRKEAADGIHSQSSDEDPEAADISDAAKIERLQKENAKLKSHLKTLTARVTQLEKQLAEKEQELFRRGETNLTGGGGGHEGSSLGGSGFVSDSLVSETNSDDSSEGSCVVVGGRSDHQGHGQQGGQMAGGIRTSRDYVAVSSKAGDGAATAAKAASSPSHPPSSSSTISGADASVAPIPAAYSSAGAIAVARSPAPSPAKPYPTPAAAVTANPVSSSSSSSLSVDGAQPSGGNIAPTKGATPTRVAAARKPTKSPVASKTVRALAALDAEDDEEDGWS